MFEKGTKLFIDIISRDLYSKFFVEMETRLFIEIMNESIAQSTWDETKIKSFKLASTSLEPNYN